MNRLFLIAVVIGAAACGQRERADVTIAAAANLTEVFQQVGPAFERQSGIHPLFSFASTSQLAQQIENGAPFDVIAAADSEHLAGLERKGLLLAGSPTPYAIGVLALWIPPGKPRLAHLADLISPAVRVIAVAKPEVAPYGQAAVEALRKTGIWNQVEPKIVYAENVRMAKQYGTTGNADAVFTAYSLVMQESGDVITVDGGLHHPIVQEVAINAKPQHLEAARKFVTFLVGSEGRALLNSFGYRLPVNR